MLPGHSQAPCLATALGGSREGGPVKERVRGYSGFLRPPAQRPTHHRVLSWQLGLSSPGHSSAMPVSPNLLLPRYSSRSEALEATMPHRSWQLAEVRPQLSSLGA